MDLLRNVGPDDISIIRTMAYGRVTIERANSGQTITTFDLEGKSLEEIHERFDILAEKRFRTRLEIASAPFINFLFVLYVLQNFNLIETRVKCNDVLVSLVPCEPMLSDEEQKFICNVSDTGLNCTSSWCIHIDKHSSVYAPMLYFCLSGYEIILTLKLYDTAKLDDTIDLVLMKNGQRCAKSSLYLVYQTNRIDFGICNDMFWIRCVSDNNSKSVHLDNIRAFRVYELIKSLKLDCLIVHGLASRHGFWGNFCSRGLYDPRLFLTIGAFYDFTDDMKKKSATIDVVDCIKRMPMKG